MYQNRMASSFLSRADLGFFWVTHPPNEHTGDKEDQADEQVCSPNVAGKVVVGKADQTNGEKQKRHNTKASDGKDHEDDADDTQYGIGCFGFDLVDDRFKLVDDLGSPISII
jgi:hypothetical protein